MAANYQYLPLSVRDIFAELVSDVSDNLSTEDTLDIGQVSFKCETWIELIKRIEAEDHSSTLRLTKYPLVALIRNFDEKYAADNDYADVSLTLVIVTPSDPNKYSEDREADNYVPILRPIYAELMEVIMGSSYFDGYNRQYPTHTKTESFQLGVDSTNGNTKYLLPDCVDGIIISDLQLRIYPDRCANTVTGATTSVSYLNNVSELSMDAGITSFTVSFVSAQYIDTLNVAPDDITYQIYTQHDGTTQDITIGQSVSFTGLDGYEDGYYYGYIVGDDGVKQSKLYFYYRVLSQKVRGSSVRTKFQLTNFVTAGTQYTDYPFDTVTRHQTHTKVISTQNVSIDGGNEMWSEVYQPSTKDTTSTTTTIEQPLATTYRDVVNSVTIDQLILENISYYKQA